MANKLEKIFYRDKGRLIYKWVHYFDIYDRHFRQYRRKPVTVVEFGVLHGGSLQMWKKYFGRRARIIGVDMNPGCKQLEEKQIEIRIGDQADRVFLRKLAAEIGPIDILIDDGGHTMKQQKTTFKEMWPALRDGGTYVIEDLHTSYWKLYGGGYQRRGTFMEFAKHLMDQLNAWHGQKPDRPRFKVDQYTRSIKAMHVYSSVIVFDKGEVVRPHDEQHGAESDIEFSYLGFSHTKTSTGPSAK